MPSKVISLKIWFVDKSTTEMLVEFAFRTYISPAKGSLVKLLDELELLIACDRAELVSKALELLIGSAASANAIANIMPLALINVAPSLTTTTIIIIIVIIEQHSHDCV
jgi:hypothetical protein